MYIHSLFKQETRSSYLVDLPCGHSDLQNTVVEMEWSGGLVEVVEESQLKMRGKEKGPQLWARVEVKVSGLWVQQSCAYISTEGWRLSIGEGGRERGVVRGGMGGRREGGEEGREG